MKTNEIIAALRYCQLSQHTDCWGCPANIGDSRCLDVLHKEAADALEGLHKRIEEMEKKLSSAVYDLGVASECWSCKRNNKCHPNSPVSGPDVCCGSYQWRGATDTNVGGKEIDAKPLTAFLSPIDAYQGLKRKYLVFKSDTGEMVENCFVLRPGKDPAAVEALRAYARATNNATLSADIFNWVGEGEKHHWIPVTERLPEIGDQCIVAVKYKYDHEKQYTYDTDVATYTFDGGYIDDCWDTYNDWDEGQQFLHVTHWMPMPEPPKEGT